MEKLNKKNKQIEKKKTDKGSGSDSASNGSTVSIRLTKVNGYENAENISKLFRKRSHTNAEVETSSGDEILAAKIPTSGRGRSTRGLGKYRSKTTLEVAQQTKKRTDEGRPLCESKEKTGAGSVLSASSTSETDTGCDTISDRKARFAAVVEAAVKEVSQKREHASKMKASNKATASIIAAAEANFSGSNSNEAVKLQEEVSRLTADMAQLRKENEKLRADLESLRGTAATESSVAQSQTTEREVVKIVRQELAALSARFSAIEGIVLRPPLASDKNNVSYATVAAKTSSVTEPQKVTKAKGKKPAQVQASLLHKNPMAQKSPPPPRALNETEWEVVGNKKKAKKAKKAKVRKTVTRLQTPRTTVVVLTLQPGATDKGVSYREVLSKAKDAVNLVELGISEGLKFRVTATGARMLEVPGTTSGPIADALAEKLRASFNAQEVKVTRPTKCASMRIIGLDDSVTVEEIVAAVAKIGECPSEQVKSSAIHTNSLGMGTAVVSCPIASAKKIAEGRRLLVGWVSAQVKLLEPKPLRCYRCQVGKHVGVKCTSDTDRSNCCFQCGQPGHIASTCTAAPHCVFCEAAGKPANHRIGSKTCAASIGAKVSKKKNFTPVTEGSAQATREEAEMETQ